MLRGHQQRVQQTAFSADGARVASGSWDCTARLWYGNPNEASPPAREIDFRMASFTHDGARIVALGPSGVHILDATSFDELVVLRGRDEPLTSICLSPGGSRLLTLSKGRASMWETTTGQELGELESPEGQISHAVFSPDGERVAAVVEKGIRIFNARSLAPEVWLRGHASRIVDAVFSSDGATIATVANDLTVGLWNSRSGERKSLLWARGPLGTVAFEPSGARIRAVGNDGTVWVWDVASRQELVSTRPESGAYRLRFSPDGARVVATSWDQSPRLWDTETWRELAVLTSPKGHALDVMFSPDGSRLIAVAGGTLQVWDSVPNRVRFAERASLRATEPEAQRVVASILETHLDQHAADAEICRRDDLSPSVRRSARNLLLRRFAEPREEAWRLVRRLEERLVVGADVVKSIEADATLTGDRRDHALRFASRISDAVEHLNRRAGNIVCSAERTEECYQGALRAATRAAELSPDDSDVSNTLGVALYRCSKFADAKSRLQRSVELRQASSKAAHASDLAFLAMVHARLGEQDEAKRLLAEFEKAMTDGQRGNDAYRQICAEARATVGGR